jgi:hypothetical protein
MPWEIERSADVVHVRIEAPMTDWDGLMRALPGKLRPKPSVVTLPSSVQGGTETDARMLKTLWMKVMELQVPVQREEQPPTVAPHPRNHSGVAAPREHAHPQDP